MGNCCSRRAAPLVELVAAVAPPSPPLPAVAPRVPWPVAAQPSPPQWLSETESLRSRSDSSDSSDLAERILAAERAADARNGRL